MTVGRIVRHDLLELAAAYSDFSVLVTTAQLDSPGPQILYANSSFTRMTGYSVTEILGKTPRILQGELTDKALLRRLKETLSSGYDFIARAVNYKQDGTPFELEWVITHLKDSSGRTTHYMAIQRDISGLKRAQADLAEYDAELQRASEQLLESMRKLEVAERKLSERDRLATLGEVTAGVVHDINNALSPIVNLVQVLHSMDHLPDDVVELTRDLDMSVENALRVLDNLKDYYKAGVPAEFQPVEIQSLLNRLPDLTRPRWWSSARQNQSISFAFTFQRNAIVSGNETDLIQLFVNLVLNAIDAMPEGGTITIELEVKDAHAVISISDTGRGMSREMLDTCFEPYVTRRIGGTGLGLALCWRIANQHNGTITVDSQEGIGTTFKVTLPLSQMPNSNSSGGGHLRALHISGDAKTQESVANLLRTLGWVVDTATDGDEGLNCFFNSTYDLVIADSSTRPTSGIEVTQCLKRSSPEVCVVLSAHDKDRDLALDLPENLRPDGFLPIPASMDNLESLLMKLGFLA